MFFVKMREEGGTCRRIAFHPPEALGIEQFYLRKGVHMGNLTATRVGPDDAPHLVVSAHADEIGAAVASIEPDGFLRLAPLGGVQPRLLEGRAVWVGGHPGVIGARSGHLTAREEQGKGVALADLYVDLGVDDATSVAALGVRIGDPVVVLSELRSLAGTRVAGKGSIIVPAASSCFTSCDTSRGKPSRAPSRP